MNTMAANPTTTIVASANESVGASAIASERTPKAAAWTARRLGVGPRRFAIASAPTSEPTPMNDSSRPSVPASPLKLSTASRGSSTEKLNENVNSTAISMSGRRSSGVVHT